MSDGIAYQNKDIEFKLLSGTFKEKSFDAYGLDLPKIKEVLPTNLPEVSVNEKRMDNLFLLEDDTIAIVDYESEDKPGNRVKYVNYIARVMERYFKEDGKIPNLRMIVIYTCDVEHAEHIFKTECLTLNMEQVFVSHLPGDDICQKIRRKLEKGERLTDRELMRLIILPLSKRGKAGKQKCIEEVVALAKLIEDEQEQVFVIAGVLVCSDKFIDREYAKCVRRYLSMTKVFQILEEEKQEAVLQAKKEATEKANRQTAMRMIHRNMEEAVIMEISGLSKGEVEKLRKDMAVNS
ncbi:MAG: hypothetical protein HFG93_00790 [Dorea sp.]|nr:hypothetical protein [Dorea sp.]MDE6938972.1 hypothetical protein [Lachnospiraceae bacterium]